MTGTMTAGDELLEIDGLDVGYGGLPVLYGLDLCVRRGEVVAVLGPNGAGKSTLLLAIAGVLWPDDGRLRVLGVEGKTSVHARVRHGLGLRAGRSRAVLGADRSRQHPDPYPCSATRSIGRSTYLPAARPAPRPAGRCPLGRRAADAGARRGARHAPDAAPARRDEHGPVTGRRRASLLPVIRSVADDEGVGVLLVEQHAPAAIEVSDRVVVLNRGRIVLEADSTTVRDDPTRLAALYLAEPPVVQ